MKITLGKISYLVLATQNFLNENHTTYDEVAEIVRILASSIEHEREELEYDTVSDFMIGRKTCDVGNDIIKQYDLSNIEME